MSLNPRQQRFVDAIVRGVSAAQAYIDAGYAPGTAETCGPRLLRNAQVAEEVARRQAEASARADVDAERIRRELAAVAFADPRSVATWGEDGVKLVPSDEISDEAAAAIASVRVTKQSITVRQHDKLRALELLGKDQGMFRERLEVEHLGLGDLFEEIRRRAHGEETG